MPDKTKIDEILKELRCTRKDLEKLRQEFAEEETEQNVYSKDFIYFAVSMFVPVGYGEVDLIPRDSLWHPIIGWICWFIPVYMGLRMLSHWLKGKRWNIPLNAGRLVVGALLIVYILGAISALRLWVERKHQGEQDDVARNLSIRVLSPLTENALESVFSVTNGSRSLAISSKTLHCGILNLHGAKNGMPISIETLNTTAVPNAAEMMPGDSRSEPCLMGWSSLVETTQCADMLLWLEYRIETQPSIAKEKEFRLAGYQARGGSFNWYPEPVKSETNYCDFFSKQVAPSH